MMKLTTHAILVLALPMFLWGCTNKPNAGTGSDPVPVDASRIEHPQDEHRQLTIHQEYNEVSKGIHLVLSFDVEESVFIGTLENVSEQLLDRVRVEIHLSNGVDLGPTTLVNLKPREKREINLSAGENSFRSWSIHAEAGSGEHSQKSEGEHGHSHN